MRMSKAFFSTLREAPAGAETAGQQLLWRAGFIRPVGSGALAYLPLGRRSLHRIEALGQAEMAAQGGQEVRLPRPVLGQGIPGSEDAALVAGLARREISSYRQLPQLVYSIDGIDAAEAAPETGAGSLLSAVSLDADEAGMALQAAAVHGAFNRVISRSGLDVLTVDGGTDGRTHLLLVPTPAGPDIALRCDACGYAAMRHAATFRKPEPPAEELQPVEKVATPHCRTIAELAAFLGVPTSRTAKAVFFVADPGSSMPLAPVPSGPSQVPPVIFALTRGDMEVDEGKLAQAVGARHLRPATEEEIRAAGAEPGYGSPVGARNCLVVVDDLVACTPNLVSGANEEGYHLRNVNSGRDYQPDVVADIVAAAAGAPCSRCGGPLRAEPGIVVASLARLGVGISERAGATFHDAEGQLHPLVMGAYQLMFDSLLAAVAEAHHDEAGLAWPAEVAPCAVHLVLLPRAGKSGPAPTEVADALYVDLEAAGVRVLYDDRTDPSPGVKFNDADLIGVPLRVTVSARSLEQGGVEVKRRGEETREIVTVEGLLASLLGDPLGQRP